MPKRKKVGLHVILAKGNLKIRTDSCDQMALSALSYAGHFIKGVTDLRTIHHSEYILYFFKIDRFSWLLDVCQHIQFRQAMSFHAYGKTSYMIQFTVYFEICRTNGLSVHIPYNKANYNLYKLQSIVL